MSLNDIISITITRQTVVPTQEGFGFANFVSPQSTFSPRIKSYADVTEVAADGLLGADAVDFAAKYFGQQIRPSKLYVTKKGGGETYVEALDAAVASNDDWYGLAIDSDLDADILAVAAWTESRIKIFGAKSADAGVYDADDEYDIATQLKDLGYDRTFLFYHQSAATVAVEGAPFGLQLPKLPGSSQWAYKQFSGVTSTSINSSQRSAALAKYANVYTDRNNLNVFENGRMVGGEWIDVIQGIDWLQARMQNNIWNMFVNNEKISYTDDGINLVTNQIREALRTSTTRNILAGDPEFTISAPRASEVSSSDKGNRLLPDISWEATLAGAIIKTTIAGRVLI